MTWGPREPHLRRFVNCTANPETCETMNYINQKTHVLHALTAQMGVTDLWQPGRTLMDLGCGPSHIAAYLQAVHGLTVIGYDVPFTAQCEGFLRSPFRVWARACASEPSTKPALDFIKPPQATHRYTGGLTKPALLFEVPPTR
eukprot:4079857-Prymnesium_polylepis.2